MNILRRTLLYGMMVALTGAFNYSIGLTATQASAPCQNNPALATVPLRVMVNAGHRLQSDGLGAYVDGVKWVEANAQDAGNLWSYPATGKNPPPTARSLKFDLRSPVPGGGGSPLGLITDKRGQFHAFWYIDWNTRYIYSIQEIPVGTPVDSERVDMVFSSGGTKYLLLMGPWGPGSCNGVGVPTSGAGSAKAQITRTSATNWNISAAPGSIATLTNYNDPTNPVVIGTYYFDLSVDISRK